MGSFRNIRAQTEKTNPAVRDFSIPYFSRGAGWMFLVGDRSRMSSKTRPVRCTISGHTPAGRESFKSVPRAWQRERQIPDRMPSPPEARWRRTSLEGGGGWGFGPIHYLGHLGPSRFLAIKQKRDPGVISNGKRPRSPVISLAEAAGQRPTSPGPERMCSSHTIPRSWS